MACSTAQIEAARIVVRRALHKALAVKAMCADLTATDATTLAVPPATAASAIASEVSRIPVVPTLAYDDVGAFIDNCPVGGPLVFQHDGCWDRMDVAVRLHFARQSLRPMLWEHVRAVVDGARAGQTWQVAKLGLQFYFSLKRIGLTRDRCDELKAVATAARGVDSGSTVHADFLAAVSVPATYVVPEGCGAWQPLLASLEQVDVRLKAHRDFMSDRLPAPRQLTPGTTRIKRGCAPCSSSGSMTCLNT